MLVWHLRSSNVRTLTILQRWFGWTGSHLIRVGGGLLLIALAVASFLGVASLLAVVGLVASLGAGVGVLLSVVSLGEGIGGGLLLLRRDVCSSEGSHPAGLLEHEPEVSYPQDQVDEAKSLWSRYVLVVALISCDRPDINTAQLSVKQRGPTTEVFRPETLGS